MAPYRAIPRDYLSDTPLLRAMGFLVSQHGQLSAIPRPPFLSVSPLESMRSGGAIPPPQKGYLSDTCAIPHENKVNGCDTPPLRYYLERVLRDMGGVSRTGPLSADIHDPKARTFPKGSSEPLKRSYRPQTGSIGPPFSPEKVLQNLSERVFRTTDRALSKLSHRTPPPRFHRLPFSDFPYLQCIAVHVTLTLGFQKRGVEFEGGSLHVGFGGLTVLAVLESTFAVFWLVLHKMQDKEATVTASRWLQLSLNYHRGQNYYKKSLYKENVLEQLIL